VRPARFTRRYFVSRGSLRIKRQWGTERGCFPCQRDSIWNGSQFGSISIRVRSKRVLAQSGLWEFDDDAPWCGIAGVGASRRGIDCVYGGGFSHQRRRRFLMSRQGARSGNRSSGVPMRWRLILWRLGEVFLPRLSFLHRGAEKHVNGLFDARVIRQQFFNFFLRCHGEEGVESLRANHSIH